jgi:hypothetical protein
MFLLLISNKDCKQWLVWSYNRKIQYIWCLPTIITICLGFYCAQMDLLDCSHKNPGRTVGNPEVRLISNKDCKQWLVWSYNRKIQYIWCLPTIITIRLGFYCTQMDLLDSMNDLFMAIMEATAFLEWYMMKKWLREVFMLFLVVATRWYCSKIGMIKSTFKCGTYLLINLSLSFIGGVNNNTQSLGCVLIRDKTYQKLIGLSNSIKIETLERTMIMNNDRWLVHPYSSADQVGHITVRLFWQDVI